MISLIIWDNKVRMPARVSSRDFLSCILHKMVSFFYKGHHDDEQYYIKCDWQNDLDYTIEQDTDLPICNFTLTTLKEFWSGTGKDLILDRQIDEKKENCHGHVTYSFYGTQLPARTYSRF